MAWGILAGAARGWDAYGWIRIGVGMHFRAALAHIGPWGVGSGPFFQFSDFSGGLPWPRIIPLFPRCGVRPISG